MRFIKTLAFRIADSSALLKYGLAAPRKHECVLVNPADVRVRIAHHKHFTGIHPQLRIQCVLDGDWDEQVNEIDFSHLKYKGLCERILDGREWSETVLYKERMQTLLSTGSADGLKDPEAMTSRYTEIDRLISEAKQQRALKRRKVLARGAFRERGGVPLLVGRGGKLILGRGGTHRFFVAQILKLKTIPMDLVAVHASVATDFPDIVGLKRNSVA